MKPQNNRKTSNNWRFVQIFILLAALVLLGSGQTSSAQIVKPRPTPPAKPGPTVAKKPHIFKGGGVKLSQIAGPTPIKRDAAPVFLTLAQKRELFAQVMRDAGNPVPDAAVTTSVRLNTRTAYVENKGFVDFYRPLFVSHKDSYAAFSGGPDQRLTVGIKPARAGQWLLVECWVGAVPGAPLRVTGPGGIVTEVPVPEPGPDVPEMFQNLAASVGIQIFLDSLDTDWQLLTVTRSSGTWGFHTCEVTALN